MRFLTTFLLGLFCFPVLLHAQDCEIKTSNTSGCVPYLVSFQVINNSSKTVASYKWNFGNGNISIDKQPIHVYQSPGNFVPTVVLTYTDNSTCKAELDGEVEIWDLPRPSATIPKNISICKVGEKTLITGGGTPGSNNAPIKRFLWDLGDGDTSLRKSFIHGYESGGKYKVVLEVSDTNGCKDTVTRFTTVTIYNNFALSLITFNLDSCPTTTINFINKTDSTGTGIESYEWNFGDGTVIKEKKGSPTFKSNWARQRHEYLKRKESFPYLKVTNSFGCKDSIQPFAVKNIWFKFDVTAKPTVPPCIDLGMDTLRYDFNQPEIPGAGRIKWNFGDGTESTISWSPFHFYSEPGKYIVTVEVKKLGCTKDTVVCDLVNILGPLAKINRHGSLRNNYVFVNPNDPGFDISKIDTCNTDTFSYVTIDTIDTKLDILRYCNADTLSKKAIGQRIGCKKKIPIYEYELRPDIIKTIDGIKLERKIHHWSKGMPLPTGNVYSYAQGVRVDGNMRDSELFSCQIPHTVHFINNSIKYRGYNAVDNFPPGFQDECINPSYPYASDSLDYFWEFQEGTWDTSTVKSPNPRSRFSTERLPVHRFEEEGCFNVILHATDPETGCKSLDSIYIIVQRPDAGWDRKELGYIKNMTYRLQNSLKGKNGRRGLVVSGSECTGTTQRADFQELLPSCRQEDVWFIFDSTEAVISTQCGGKNYVKYNWYKKTDNLNYILGVYDKEGWKTPGVVIKSGDCYDTMWYHNYKYIYNIGAAIGTNKPYLCPGDTFDVFDVLDSVQGVEYAIFDYIYRKDLTEPAKIIWSDTLDFIRITDQNGKKQVVTSSIHKPESGINDVIRYNNLSQHSQFITDKPGHYTVILDISYRMGCSSQSFIDITSGYNAKFQATQTQLCLGDKVQFIDSIRYYKSFFESDEGYDSTKYWEDPYSTRSYKPRYPEEVKWDFDGDSIPDASGSHPTYTYTKPGTYTVRMFTRDSLGCDWVVTEKKDYIRVVSLKTDFAVDDNSNVRFCAPQFFTFKDLTTLDQGNSKVRDTIRYWRWDWGDGSSSLKTSLVDGTTGKSYKHNKAYRILLTVFTESYLVNGSEHCTDTISHFVYIRGPRPRFKMIDSVGCVPFTASVADQTKGATLWEWRLGNSESKSSQGEATVNLAYRQPGTFCVSLTAGDTIRDINDSVFFCIDNYPYKKCQFKVKVLPKNLLQLDNDTSVCIHQPAEFVFSSSDSSYTSYVLDFGDGNKQNKIIDTTYHAYDAPGRYGVRFSGVGAECPDSGYTEINVIGAQAAFVVDSTRLDTPQFYFLNKSETGDDFYWGIDGVWNPSNGTELSHRFTEAGFHTICLKANNYLDCPDTVCQEIEILTGFKIPNVFTPNGDGVNDVFRVITRGATAFELKIFNRWGEPVFRTENPREFWNGLRFNQGDPCASGTYFYIGNYQLVGGAASPIYGTVTLIR